MYFLRSQAPDLRLLQAWTTLRLMASIRAIVCSAALRVLPPGVFITRMPLRVAAGTSMLSTPTPARATAFKPARVGQDLGRYLRLAADDQTVVIADDIRQLIFTDPDLEDRFGARCGVDQVDSLLSPVCL